MTQEEAKEKIAQIAILIDEEKMVEAEAIFDAFTNDELKEMATLRDENDANILLKLQNTHITTKLLENIPENERLDLLKENTQFIFKEAEVVKYLTTNLTSDEKVDLIKIAHEKKHEPLAFLSTVTEANVTANFLQDVPLDLKKALLTTPDYHYSFFADSTHTALLHTINNAHDMSSTIMVELAKDLSVEDKLTLLTNPIFSENETPDPNYNILQSLDIQNLDHLKTILQDIPQETRIQLLTAPDLEGANALHNMVLQDPEILQYVLEQIPQDQRVDALNSVRDINWNYGSHIRGNILSQTADPYEDYSANLTVIKNSLSQDQFISLLTKRGDDGITAMHHIGISGRTELINNALDGIEPASLPALINIKDHHGNSILHKIEGIKQEAINLLIEKGIDINVPNNDGLTALQTAILNRDDTLARKLLNKGAPAHELTKDGQSLETLVKIAYDPKFNQLNEPDDIEYYNNKKQEMLELIGHIRTDQGNQTPPAHQPAALETLTLKQVELRIADKLSDQDVAGAKAIIQQLSPAQLQKVMETPPSKEGTLANALMKYEDASVFAELLQKIPDDKQFEYLTQSSRFGEYTALSYAAYHKLSPELIETIISSVKPEERLSLMTYKADMQSTALIYALVAENSTIIPTLMEKLTPEQQLLLIDQPRNLGGETAKNSMEFAIAISASSENIPENSLNNIRQLASYGADRFNSAEAYITENIENEGHRTQILQALNEGKAIFNQRMKTLSPQLSSQAPVTELGQKLAAMNTGDDKLVDEAEWHAAFKGEDRRQILNGMDQNHDGKITKDERVQAINESIGAGLSLDGIKGDMDFALASITKMMQDSGVKMSGDDFIVGEPNASHGLNIAQQQQENRGRKN